MTTIVVDGSDSFLTIYNAFTWREIPGCPGRYVTSSRNIAVLSTVELTNVYCPNSVICNYSVPGKDNVTVCRFVDSGGGIITFVKDKNNVFTYVHTLNTESGFIRKLLGLKIPLSDFDTPNRMLNIIMKLVGWILMYLEGSDRNVAASILVEKWNLVCA